MKDQEKNGPNYEERIKAGKAALLSLKQDLQCVRTSFIRLSIEHEIKQKTLGLALNEAKLAAQGGSKSPVVKPPSKEKTQQDQGPTVTRKGQVRLNDRPGQT